MIDFDWSLSRVPEAIPKSSRRDNDTKLANQILVFNLTTDNISAREKQIWKKKQRTFINVFCANVQWKIVD